MRRNNKVGPEIPHQVRDEEAKCLTIRAEGSRLD